jgi:Mrp family chromosome partitioning ATPase
MARVKAPPAASQAFDGSFLRLRHRLGEVCGSRRYVVFFSACHRGAGTSSLALGFATAVATDTSDTVLLIDANFRDPVLHARCGVPRAPGLSDVLADEGVDVQGVVRRVGPGSLHLLPAGRVVEHPTRVADGERFGKILDRLTPAFDVIVVDSAPVASCVETLQLMARSDGLVLVLEAERTRWEVAQAVKSRMLDAHQKFLGCILNRRRFLVPDSVYRRR